MDPDKAYNRIDWLALWDILKIYGVGGKLLHAITLACATTGWTDHQAPLGRSDRPAGPTRKKPTGAIGHNVKKKN